MKRALIFLSLLLIVLTAIAQPKTRDRVKRKYRNVERVSENLPQVIFRGLVRDINKIPIPGASIEIEGIKRLVHSNEFGQFMLSDLPTGRLRLKVSCIGYRTKTSDFVLQAGFNDHYVALDQERVHLETLISSSQKREQQIPDIPSAVSVVNNSFADRLSVNTIEGIAKIIPVLSYLEPGAGKAGFSFPGTINNAGFTEISPSVAVFSDEVPLTQPGGISPLFFDMERVEVLSGPQNTLFGRNALGGALHFVSKKPDNYLRGFIQAGGGNYGAKEVTAAVNVPVINEMLFIRAAGIYSASNGYVENTQGGTLNGTNNYGGRFSLRFLPVYNHKLDVTLNYNKNDHSGMAFMNPWFAGEVEDLRIEKYLISLNRGEELGSQQELIDGTLTYRYFLNEHDYWTLISSFRKSNASDAWDADGTDLPALGMDDEIKTDKFYQEIRYNFSRKSRTNGSAGLSYNHERNSRWHGISSSDQFIYEIFSSPGNFVMPSENRYPVNPQPLNDSPLAGFPLSGPHTEEILNEQLTQSAQAYFHLTYRLMQRLFLTGGVRGFYDRVQLAHESLFTGGSESKLGQFTGSAPNLLYLPFEKQQLTKNNMSFAGEAIITYRWNENLNYYLKAARGIKPQVLLFTWESQPMVVKAEQVNSAEAGLKTTIKQRVYWSAAGFYRRHINVQTLQWGGTPGNGLLAGNGKATSYGIETTVRAALVKGIDLFGNYNWLQSAFDSTGVDGNEFIYAGNSFARAPEHSFSAGLTAKATVLKGLHLFASPWYTWKSHFWFTEANSSGLVQNAYGLLNINAGVELDNPKVALSIYGTNLLEEFYHSSAGHWGGMFGMPTVMPGKPRMLGAKVKWNF